MQSLIELEFSEHLKTAKDTIVNILKPIESAAKICINGLQNGNKILICINF